MAQALLASVDYVKKFTVIDDNVDADIITKFIIKGQDLNIQSVLGQNLYSKLINDCPTFTGPYLTLVRDFVQPALVEWVVYHSLPFLNFKLTNKNVAKRDSDNSVPSDLDELKWLRAQVRDNAEFYSERMRDFIKNNPNDFPEYYRSDLSFEVKPAKSAYFPGIYTSKRVSNRPDIYPNNTDPCDIC